MAGVPAVPDEKDTTKVSFAQAVIDALTELSEEVGSTSLLKNGSFEDVDAGEPLLWVVSDSAGGSHAISDATESGGEAHHGQRSLQMTTTGSGGFVEALSDRFLAVGGGDTILCAGYARRDTSGIRKRVQLLYYDADKSIVSTDTLEDNSDSALTYVTIGGTSDAPANARFYKVKLIGGVSGGAIAGNVFFDGFSSVLFLRPSDLEPEIFSTAGATTYTVPPGVVAVHIAVAGAGGGGGSAAGGGGGGSGFLGGLTVAVSPNDVLVVTVGAGGTGGLPGNDGAAGGVSWVALPGGNFANRYASASGGNGGISGSGSKAGGTGWNNGAAGAASVGGAGADHVYGTGGAGGGNDATGNCAGGGGQNAVGNGGDGADGYIIMTPHLL